MESSFSLPEDYSELSAEDIQELIETARAEFSAIYESDDVSNEALEELQRLADGIEAIVGEQNTRLAAAKRVELAAQVASTEVVEETPEVAEVEATEFAAKAKADAVEGSPEEEATETPEEEAKEKKAEKKAAPVFAADVETPIEVLDPQEVVVAASKPAPSVAIPEATTPNVVIAAAVDVPQFYVGQRLDPSSLADALHNKARMLSDSRGNQTVYPVATIERPFGQGYDLEGLDQSATWDAIAKGSAPSALTASGGWCAPSQLVYDLFEVECTSDNLFTLPTFKVTRGGIRWPVFTAHDETLNPGFVWTEANDIAAVTGSPTKPCVTIPCPTFTEVRLDAVGLCITAGNLMDRAYPEQIQWFLNRAMRAYERNSAARQLTAVLADTVASTIAASFGAGSAVISALLLEANDYRQIHGLCAGEVLDVTAPYWLTDLIKADIARQDGTLNGVGSLPTDADVDSFFAAANLNLKYIDHWQYFTHPALTWPTTVQVLISYPGSYVRFDGGRLDIGVVRDSTLNKTNDYTAVWFEEFYAVGRRGPQGRLITVTVCPNGEVGARRTGGAAATCPIG